MFSHLLKLELEGERGLFLDDAGHLLSLLALALRLRAHLVHGFLDGGRTKEAAHQVVDQPRSASRAHRAQLAEHARRLQLLPLELHVGEEVQRDPRLRETVRAEGVEDGVSPRLPARELELALSVRASPSRACCCSRSRVEDAVVSMVNGVLNTVPVLCTAGLNT